jgi:hypothetical protein
MERYFQFARWMSQFPHKLMGDEETEFWRPPPPHALAARVLF